MYRIIAVSILLFLSGCFGSWPKVKRVKELPVPRESYESEEQTRQALQLIRDHCKHAELSDILPVIDALILRFGMPVTPLPLQTDLVRLAARIRITTENYRIAMSSWRKKYEAYTRYRSGEGEEKTIIQKTKSWIFWALIIFGAIAIISPPAAAVIIRFVKRRAKQLEKTLRNTAEAVQEIKETDPETWEKIKPSFQKRHDPDDEHIVKKVKNGRNH